MVEVVLTLILVALFFAIIIPGKKYPKLKQDKEMEDRNEGQKPGCFRGCFNIMVFLIVLMVFLRLCAGV